MIDFLRRIGGLLTLTVTGIMIYAGAETIYQTLSSPLDLQLFALNCTKNQFVDYLEGEKSCPPLLFETLVKVQRFELAARICQKKLVTNEDLFSSFMHAIHTDNIGRTAQAFFLRYLSEDILEIRTHGTYTLIECLLMLSRKHIVFMDLTVKFLEQYPQLYRYMQVSDVAFRSYSPFLYYDQHFLTGIDDILLTDLNEALLQHEYQALDILAEKSHYLSVIVYIVSSCAPRTDHI